MSWNKNNINKYIRLFSELLFEDNTYSWTFDDKGELTFTNCPYPIFKEMLDHYNCIEYAAEYGNSNGNPLIITLPNNLTWCLAFEKDLDKLKRIHLLGPVFSYGFAIKDFEPGFEQENADETSLPDLQRIVETLPSLYMSVIFHYTLQLDYYCTGIRRHSGHLYVKSYKIDQAESKETHLERNGSKTYLAEKRLISAIRNGDVDYAKTVTSLQQNPIDFTLRTNDRLVKAKFTSVFYSALCVHAAIEGGILPGDAYSRCCVYVQNVVDCSSPTEVIALNRNMFGDFVQLVRAKNTAPKLSKEIQTACDFIDFYITDKLSISSLAKQIGYTDYYLSKKFKKETGISINEYIKNSKMNYAKNQLIHTNKSISDISFELNFSARSFFADTFKKTVGMSPAAFRTENKVF